jgi:RNA polymerase primary sigma factor
MTNPFAMQSHLESDVTTPDATNVDDEMTGQLWEPEPRDFTAREEQEVRAAETGADLDLVRLYFDEIGRVPLLTAKQEVAIGRRMEDARRDLLGRLVEIPMVRRALVDIGVRLRRGEMGAETVIVLPEGGEPDAAEVRRVSTALMGLGAKARARGRPPSARRPAGHRARVTDLPLDPQLVEDLVTRVREARGIRPATLARIEHADAAVRAAKRDLAEANLRLVVSVARRYLWTRIPLADLVQEGNLGLLKAVDKFQYRRGFKFSTYATWWIRQAITRSIADRGRTIRVPVHMLETLQRVSRARGELFTRLQRQPTVEEVARHTRIPAAKVQLVLEAAPEPVSLEMPIGDDATLADFLEDRSSTSPVDGLAEEELSTRLERSLADLAPREREVIRLRFGLGGGETMTLDEIGQRFGLTRERIRQIEMRALTRLRRSGKDLREHVRG